VCVAGKGSRFAQFNDQAGAGASMGRKAELVVRDDKLNPARQPNADVEKLGRKGKKVKLFGVPADFGRHG